MKKAKDESVGKWGVLGMTVVSNMISEDTLNTKVRQPFPDAWRQPYPTADTPD